MTHRADPIRLGALGERSAWGPTIFIVKLFLLLNLQIRIYIYVMYIFLGSFS